MRVLVCGGRRYSDGAAVARVLSNLRPKMTFLMEGGATGADWLARRCSRHPSAQDWRDGMITEEMIARLKAATGPDRELDRDIAKLVGRSKANMLGIVLPAFTASVNDAVSLIPDECFWLIAKGNIRPPEPMYGAQVLRKNGEEVAIAEHDGSAALATCIAALCARKAITDQAEGETE